jgi:DNA-directed RNA polymerase specialized sigma24 family protein
MKAYQAGSLDAFTQLYLRMRDQLAGLLRGLVDDDRVVEQLIEQSFLLAHRARHTYVPPQPVTNWLYAIACHVAERHQRAQKTRLAR